MASENIPKKRVVWQDIKPANSPPQISPRKKKIGKIALILISIKKPFVRLLLSLKNIYKIGGIFSAKQKKIILLLIITIFVVLGGFIVRTNFIDKRITSSGIKVEDLAAKNPEYQTFIPSGKKISELGGWKRVSPNDRVAVFAYVDEIDSVQINVSQQQLPEDFKDDTATQIEQLAKGFKADQKITIGDIVVYIGTSVKGPQSVIFYKNQTLILIKSTSKISNESWTKYISNLN